MIKFIAIVTACGIYQGTNRVCLEWTDNAWHASREKCMERAQAIVSKVKSLTWYASVKLERNPVPRCKQIGG